MDENIPDRLIIEVIARVVTIEKQFAHVTGARTERRVEVKNALSQLVAEHLEQ